MWLHCGAMMEEQSENARYGAMMISGGVLGACGMNEFLVSGCMC